MMIKSMLVGLFSATSCSSQYHRFSEGRFLAAVFRTISFVKVRVGSDWTSTEVGATNILICSSNMFPYIYSSTRIILKPGNNCPGTAVLTYSLAPSTKVKHSSSGSPEHMILICRTVTGYL